MNILTDRPPDTVNVSGRQVPVRTDFRQGILFEQAALRGAGAEELLGIFFEEIPEDREGALAAALRFYCCGETPAAVCRAGPAEPVYDFGEDAGTIMASFSAVYGVDLASARMHWWTFRALLRALPPESAFGRLVALRTMDVTGLDEASRRRVQRAQQAVRLRTGGARSLRDRDEAWRRRIDERFRKAGENHGA